MASGCDGFSDKVKGRAERIAEGEAAPPLIIGYTDGTFEINCNNPLFEALVRVGQESYPVIIWMSQRTDYLGKDDLRF